LYALENKNNDHRTNGEFWLMRQLSSFGTRTIFDVGANVGKWSLHAEKVFEDATIFSFEPMPEVFAKLRMNVSKIARIKIFELALSNETAVLTFNYYPKSNLLSSIYTHYRGGESFRVQVRGVDGDSFCEENQIKDIDFLKLDAEGSEHLILQGFQKMLAEERIKVIQFEYGTFSIDSKFLLKDYYDFFSRYNYTVGKIFPNYVDFRPYHWSYENFVGPNYLAIRKSETALIKLLKD
jgi:FkbM family methyltransferase